MAFARGAIRHSHAHGAGIADDMEIGDDQPVLRDHEARTVTAGADALDAAHGRADTVDSIGNGCRVSVEQSVIGWKFFGCESHGRVPSYNDDYMCGAVAIAAT
jgi:hypothetical protein